MTSRQFLAWFLRLAGAVEIFAFIAVFMPRSWMEVSHDWLGMGEMPDGPVLMFLIRQASYVYGFHGVSLLFLASDVVKFRKLIILNGISFLLAGPVFFWIDWTAGMPWWWTLSDPLSCAFTGALLLFLTLGRPSNS
jgi:hypothetical protein